jgi:hypothetical protein
VQGMKKLIALMLLFGWGSAQAAVVITAVESGGEVVFSTDGGTLDLTGLIPIGKLNAPSAAVNPFQRFVLVGAEGFALSPHSGISSFPAYGEMGALDTTTPADSTTGTLFGIGSSSLLLPAGLVSGGTLGPASATYNSSTFASLGLNQGSYLWSWTGDSITVNIVPIPAAVWLFGSGLGLLGWMRRRSISQPLFIVRRK